MKVVGEQFLLEIFLKVFNSVKLKTNFYTQTTYKSNQNNPLFKIILSKENFVSNHVLKEFNSKLRTFKIYFVKNFV